MPSQQSVSVCNINGFHEISDEELSDDRCLLLLRKKECLAYHHICGVFRAQGRLSPEKLKLLKEIASVLCIPEVRHKAECRIAVNNDELNRIAECVAGPDTEEEWRKEAMEDRVPEPEVPVASAYLPMADAVAKVIYESIKSDPTRKTWSKTIKLSTLLSGNVVERNKVKQNLPHHKINGEVKEETLTLMTEDEIKEEDKDGESSSSVSTTSEPEDLQTLEETGKEEKVGELEKETLPDSILMPPPSPIITAHPSSSSSPFPSSSVINVPHTPAPAPVESPPSTPAVITVPPSSSIITLPSSPAVITVPPSSSILTLPSTPAVITVPPSSSILTLSSPSPAVITVPPPTSLSVSPSTSVPVTISIPPPPVLTTPALPSQTKACEIDEGTPVLSDDLQFVSLTESMDSSLPPLVVVPPPEPVITVPPSPTLIIPSGMSIQLREESEESKKRKRSLSQDSTCNESSASNPKTMNFSQLSKMTPVMVSVGNMSAAGLKVTPTTSRAKMTVTTQSSLPTSSQKVIIVSNASSGCAPMIQRSLNVPLGVPFIRTTQPRLQSTPVSSGLGKVRPRMVTVPAKCRAKSSPLVIPVSGHNLQLKNTFNLKQDNVTVVDTSDKKKVLFGSMTPTKILPKPQASMFIVNTSQGPQKSPTAMGLQAGGQATRMLSPRVVEGPGPKQNLVILQKGGGKIQRVTVTNTSKDCMQKLISKKCVVIQSSKALPKTICPKPSPPASGSSSSGSNVVVLDLSQEQYNQNLSTMTIAEILQASGILAVSSATPTITTTPPHTTSITAPEPSSNWLTAEASKNFALEEVTLPLGQSESIVTLDEAVELLGETAEHAIEVEPQTNSSDQLYTLTSDLAGSNMILTEMSSTDDLSTSQFLPAEVEGELIRQQFASHRDGAVTIQHSNIDMPANMSLEEYSSQQLENQGLH